MDKYRRKQQARWEAKKAKSQFKFEERIQEYFDNPALDKIESFGDSYKPHPTRALVGVIKQANVYLEELRILQAYPTHRLTTMAQWLLVDDVEFPWFYMMASSRPHPLGMRHSEYQDLIVFDDRKLERRIDVPKTINAIRNHKDNKLRRDCLKGILRNAHRLDSFREELAVATQRFRAIQNCHLIKEELMMNVWHPRRVEHILETYGWEAYENLIGV